MIVIIMGGGGGDNMMVVAMFVIMMIEVAMMMYELDMDLWEPQSFLSHVTSDSSMASPFPSGRAHTEGSQCCFSGLLTIVSYLSQCFADALLTSAQGQEKVWATEKKTTTVFSSPGIPSRGPSHHLLT